MLAHSEFKTSKFNRSGRSQLPLLPQKKKVLDPIPGGDNLKISLGCTVSPQNSSGVYMRKVLFQVRSSLSRVHGDT